MLQNRTGPEDYSGLVNESTEEVTNEQGGIRDPLVVNS